MLAVGKMWNCGMETVERCCEMSKMRNAKICHMWAIVCPREGILIPMNGRVYSVLCVIW